MHMLDSRLTGSAPVKLLIDVAATSQSAAPGLLLSVYSVGRRRPALVRISATSADSSDIACSLPSARAHRAHASAERRSGVRTPSPASSNSTGTPIILVPRTGSKSAAKAATQAVSCSSSSDGDGGAAHRNIDSRAMMARSRMGRSSVSSDSSNSVAEQPGLPSTVQRRAVAFGHCRVSPGEGNLPVGFSATQSGAEAETPRQHSGSVRHGLASLGSTSVSLPVAASNMTPLVAAPTANGNGVRRAARSRLEATDLAALPAATRAVRLTVPSRRRHARRLAAGTVAMRKVGRHTSAAVSDRAQQRGTSVRTAFLTAVRPLSPSPQSYRIRFTALKRRPCNK